MLNRLDLIYAKRVNIGRMMKWRGMNNVHTALIAVFALMLSAVDAAAQINAKMYCWKNKAGKTECGDKVPYENQASAIRELNKQGVVTTRSAALTPEERKRREIVEDRHN